jgi:pyruvate/2-oxoacid:ferredoxin oxidoreductase beta subunit
MNAPEAEYCWGCGETIKADTCLAIFVAASSASMESTVVAFKSGRLCATLQRPPGIS